MSANKVKQKLLEQNQTASNVNWGVLPVISVESNCCCIDKACFYLF